MTVTGRIVNGDTSAWANQAFVVVPTVVTQVTLVTKPPISITTDGNGEFSAKLSAGTYQLKLQETEPSIEFKVPESDDSINLAMLISLTMAGTLPNRLT